MGKSKTRKGSVGGYMLTDEQMTDLINKSTVKPSDRPDKNDTKDKKNG